jgi:uncharacterized protein
VQEAVVHSYTIVHLGFGVYKEKAPYCLAILILENKKKILSILEKVDLEKIKIGDKVNIQIS